MKNIILFSLAFALLPLTHSFAQTTDNASAVEEAVNLSETANEDFLTVDSSTIADFEVVKVVPDKSSSPKTETVKDIAVPIQIEKTEEIPPQSSIPAQASAKPTINSEAIKNLLAEHVPQFRACYQQELDSADKPETLKGSINLKFTIAKSGKVAGAEVTSQNFHSEKVQVCIKSVLEGIKFPEASKSVRVNQPMNLNSVRQ